MKITSKLLTGIVVFLLAGYLTLPANARLSAGGSVSYDSSGSCGKSLTYTIENRVLKIQGTGDMYDYNYMDIPWDLFAFEEIVIESGVTSVGDYAFSYGSENGSPLTSVQFPDTLKRIGRYAFCCCNSLKELNLPKSITMIDEGAFSDCIGLVNVELPEGLVTIENDAFFHCAALSELKIPDSVINIGTDIMKGSGVPEPHPASNVNIPATWAKTELEEATALGLVTENTINCYRNNISRVQIAELAVNLAEKLTNTSITPAPEDTFWDRMWDERDIVVRKAVAAGIVNGKDENHFAPRGNASREEIAVIFCRTAAYVKEHSEGYAGLNMEANLSAQYTDATEVSSWAGPSVAALTEAGILTGTSDTTLSPQNQTSVQEAIILTLRLYKHILG